MSRRIVFITGTDTGVGKTLLTALLLCHLRERGSFALALKPFCSGGRADAALLRQFQQGDLTLNEINPFHFSQPLAPLIQARKYDGNISLEEVAGHIKAIAARLDSLTRRPGIEYANQSLKLENPRYLLIEGSGGLLVPLGEKYTVRDLILHLNSEVIVVSRNKLGTINHTLLTVKALQEGLSRSRSRGKPRGSWPRSSVKVVLMDHSAPDLSSRSNPAILRELLDPVPLVRLPYLGRYCRSVSVLKKAARQHQKTLAQMVN